MAKYLCALIIIILLCQQGLWAQDKSFALLRKIQGLELLSNSLSRQLEKVSLQVIVKQKDYELLLSGSDTPSRSLINMVAVESEVVRAGNYYRIEARLIDIKTKKLLSKAARDQIREEDLLRIFQAAMEAIFIQHDQNNFKKKETNDNKPTITNSVELKKKVANTAQLNTPDHHSLDFKKRVQDLQSGVDSKIVEVIEDKKDEAAKAKSKENNSTISILNPNQLVTEEPFEKVKSPKIYDRQHRVTIGRDSRDISSVGLVETTLKAQMLHLKASGHSPTAIFDGRTAWSYDLGYSSPQSAPVKTPLIYQVGLYGTWLGPYLNFSIGLFRDASFFVNLANPGEGLQPNAIMSSWLRAKTEITLPFKYPWKIGASFASPIQVESDYGPLATADKWQGSHLHLDMSPHYVVFGFEFNIMLERLNLTTQGDVPFTFNESRLAFSIRRSL
jgi:hypothetical protein